MESDTEGWPRLVRLRRGAAGDPALLGAAGCLRFAGAFGDVLAHAQYAAGQPQCAASVSATSLTQAWALAVK